MTRLLQYKRWAMVLTVLAGLWLLSGKVIMELEWRPASPEGLARIAAASAQGQSGPFAKSNPCMMHQAVIDLDLALEGPFPIGLGRDIVMEVIISSDSLMVDSLYLGPPTRHLVLQALPICLSGPELPKDAQEDAAYGYVIVQFTDVENQRFVAFQGEESFPILAWRRALVQWASVPWYMERGESYSQIMVTPL